MKSADTSSVDSSAWSDIAGKMWESLRSDFTSLKPAGTGKDSASTENPGSGAGGGISGEFPAKPTNGIMTGDGLNQGKKSEIDQKGFLHFGDIVTGDGGAKLPPSDDRGAVQTGGKLNRETDSIKKSPNEENGGIERHAGKEIDKTGRREGSVPYFPTSPGDSQQRPGKEQMPKPDRSDVETTKSGTDVGGREDVKGQPSLTHPPFRGDHQMSKYGPHPDSAPAEIPSTEDQEAASDLVHNDDISSIMGLDSVSQEAADAIISGNFTELQGILKGLEDKGPEGAAQLDAMAKQLGNLLGTNVRPEISDNRFSLNVETAFSDNRGGCFPTGTSETHLNIPSTGDISAAGSRYWNPAFPRAASADAAVETTRLQALATRSVLGLPSLLHDEND